MSNTSPFRARGSTHRQNGKPVSVDLDSLPVTITDIERAAELLEGVIERTPVAHSRALSQRLGSEVFFKCENLQRAGSFKVRGAYVRMAKLSEEEKKRGVVAASAGNHAQGVALAADRLGIKARIYMPLGAALPKITATRDHGAEVELYGVTVDEALAEAKRYAEETGAVFVHPFDNEDIIAGQGTDWPGDSGAGARCGYRHRGCWRRRPAGRPVRGDSREGAGARQEDQDYRCSG